MIAASNGLEDFIDMHVGDEKIPLPGVGEVVLSVGGNFEKRCIDQVEYAVFEIKNGKII